jgi:hypothetical protein
MKKWEYLYVGAVPVSYRNKEVKFVVNGETMKSSRRLGEYLQELGEQGWEMVTVFQDPDPAYPLSYFFFKRPKPE